MVYMVFPYGETADEVMLMGHVAHGRKDGKKAEADWAARAEIVQVGGDEDKMRLYQVYLVRADLMSSRR